MTRLLDILNEKDSFNRENFMPGLSVDCVVFGFHDYQLKVLLLKLLNSSSWALPGGYIYKNEDLHTGANRILEERTGAKDIFLNQFKTFGKLNRSEGFFSEFPDHLWQKQRFISVGYYALIDYELVIPTVDIFSEACQWIDIQEIPSLMMDHQEILEAALKQLRLDLNYKPIGSNLLPEKFTLPELQRLYEIILGKKLNRGNFYRKMKRYDILQKTNETRKGGAHKAPDLYRFDQEKYNQALEDGLQESW